MRKKSIIINERSHKELKNLAQEHQRNIGRFTKEMILYFQKTGTDPQAIKGKNASEMIKVIDRRIVSFFKTQESEILYPIQRRLLKNGERTEARSHNVYRICSGRRQWLPKHGIVISWLDGLY